MKRAASKATSQPGMCRRQVFPKCRLILNGLSIYSSTTLVDLGRFLTFLMYTQSVRLLGRGIRSLQDLCLPRTTQTQLKGTQYRHPCLEWDSNPMIPVFERTKTVYALDGATTVIGKPRMLERYLVSWLLSFCYFVI
jgi:hypothetical protein